MSPALMEITVIKETDVLKQSKSRHQRSLGVDITSCVVNVVQLSFIDHTYCIEAYAQKPLPEGAILGDEISDIEAVSQCIKQALASANIHAKAAICAIPESAVFSKTLSIYAQLREQDIEYQVILEASKYLSYSADDLSVDFKILGPSSTQSSMLEVWMIASKSSIVCQRVESLKRANLKTMVVDVDSYAMNRRRTYFNGSALSDISNIRFAASLDKDRFCEDWEALGTAMGLALRGIS
jgi:type IV pilus assembly protein PilM